jgi:RNA polymerase sigma-70 factor (ECF subfamily)
METKVTEKSKSALLDLELINSIKNESTNSTRKAYNALFDKYYKPMLFHFKGMVNIEEDAVELTQEALIKMSTNIEKFNEEQSAFSTWLFSITKNVFIDFMRRKKEDVTSLSEIGTFNEDSEVVEFDIPCSSLTPEQTMLTKERNVVMMRIINNMEKKEYATLIKMRYFDELSYEEIAEKSNKPLGTVKGYLNRAKELLKKEFEKNCINY